MSYSCSEKTYLKNNSTSKSIVMVLMALDGFCKGLGISCSDRTQYYINVKIFAIKLMQLDLTLTELLMRIPTCEICYETFCYAGLTGHDLIMMNKEIQEIILPKIKFNVQPFSSNQTKFSGSWDCVGFFTVPIWCALLVTLLLLFILFSGMYMLGDIKTMDRFDDPKGKPIMVATTD
ncbi:uncharacterized protein LOC119595583 [Penaeus monodon]|uniref:uncharacterized protein LOC119595583 n=1 Tax=Penaeus monodon TaxID=6687 RepID=UPI0018A7C29A|nr:uncharacterized protein LOC119595583 [Penaeus monodon]